MGNVANSHERIVTIAVFSLVFSLVAYYYLVVFGIEFTYNDDLLTLTQVKNLNILEIFSSTIIDSFYYRPIIQLVMKWTQDCFETIAYPVRIAQICLHLAVLILFFKIGRSFQLKKTAIYIGMLVLCFSPLTYSGIAKYGIEIGTYILGFIFAFSLFLIVRNKASISASFVLSVLALATREQGLLIAFTFFLYFLFSKKITGWLFMIVLVILYLCFRATILGQSEGHGFMGSTGWFFDFLTVPQLEERFGSKAYLLFSYNIVAHLLSIFFYIPVEGQLTISGPYTSLFMLTSLVTSITLFYYFFKNRIIHEPNKTKCILILLIVTMANAVIAYSYCRHRMLFMAGVSVSILVSFSIHNLLSADSPPKVKYITVFVLCFLWGCTGVTQTTLLKIKARKIEKHYIKIESAIPGVEQSIYDLTRMRLRSSNEMAE